MILEIIVVVLLISVFYFWYKNREWEFKFEQRVRDWMQKEERAVREDAILRSSRTLSGKTLEKLVPFLDEFPYDPHDIRWLGDPIDLVIFDGLSSSKTSGENIKSIVLCEVKSGDSTLTKTQSRIKKLVEDKKVFWDEFRIGNEKE